MSRPRSPAGLAPALAVTLALACVVPAQTSTVDVPPSRDTTLYEDATGSIGNGSGSWVFVGRTGQLRIVRALLHFDVAAFVPRGATIQNVELQLVVTRTGAMTIGMHALRADWGEGPSVGTRGGGAGAPAIAPDATWLHRHYPTVFWTAPGGDFDPMPLATGILGASDTTLTFASTPSLVTTVQSMLDQPATNHGVMLRGDETGSARRFESRESTPNLRPFLRVRFAPPQAICTTRNGTGLNPVQCRCTTPPALGTTWMLDTGANAATTRTFVWLATAALPQPVALFGGEVLVAPPVVPTTSSGVHAIPLPQSPALLGVRLFVQGGRIDAVSGSDRLVLLNAIEAVLG